MDDFAEPLVVGQLASDEDRVKNLIKPRFIQYIYSYAFGMKRDKSNKSASKQSKSPLCLSCTTAWALALGCISLLMSACSTMTPSLPVASAKLAENTSSSTLSYMAMTPAEERYRLVISIPDQRMALLEGHTIVAEYVISTALKGVSEAFNTDGTPRGLHVISEKLGHGQPVGMIFKGREPIGEISPLNPTGIPPVVTRLFRLRGLEASNQTTYDRLIYLHGSPHERLLGQPASGGCIRMSSDDVLALFDTIEVGTSISILEEPLAMAITTTLNREQRFAQLRQKVRSDLEAEPINKASPHSLCAGHMYGINGIPLNYLAARQWCRVAAENGEPSAITLLGELHEFGRIEAADLFKARALYEQAAAMGHPYALKKAEYMQRKGIGGTWDLLKAKSNAARLATLASEKQKPTTTDAANAARNPSQ